LIAAVKASDLEGYPAKLLFHLLEGQRRNAPCQDPLGAGIATRVERYSRYLLLVRALGKGLASVVGALVRKVNDLPSGLFLSLTWDIRTASIGVLSLEQRQLKLTIPLQIPMLFDILGCMR
jgi:hypothetical protein